LSTTGAGVFEHLLTLKIVKCHHRRGADAVLAGNFELLGQVAKALFKKELVGVAWRWSLQQGREDPE